MRTHFLTGLLIFVTALVVRLVCVEVYGKNILVGDGVEYHNLAVNLVRGNGFTLSKQAPFEPYFLRTPGYPLFLASIYGAVSPWHEPKYQVKHPFEPSDYPEIAVARAVQSVLGAISCLIFFLTLRRLFSTRVALITTFGLAAYIPLAVHSAFLIRETFQTFLVVAMSYTFVRFAQERRILWLVAFSCALALSNLTLVVTLGVSPLLYFVLRRALGDWRQAFMYGTGSGILVLLLIAPWLLRTWEFYPDWRILKTMGSSHTFESRRYLHATFEARNKGIISDKEGGRLFNEWWKFSERERFAMSFSGEFDGRADALETSRTLIERLTRLVTLFRLSWIESLWVVETDDGRIHLRPHTVYKGQGNTAWLVGSSVGFVFGAIAFIGAIRYAARLWYVLPVLFYFYLIFPFVAGEPRRMLAAHVLLILFAVLAARDARLALRKKFMANST